MSMRVPKLREHRGRARVTFDGKDYYCGSWDTKRNRPSPAAIQEYERLLGRWLAGGREMPVAPTTGPTVEDVLAAFWLHAESYYRRSDGTQSDGLGNIKDAMVPVRRLFDRTDTVQTIRCNRGVDAQAERGAEDEAVGLAHAPQHDQAGEEAEAASERELHAPSRGDGDRTGMQESECAGLEPASIAPLRLSPGSGANTASRPQSRSADTARRPSRRATRGAHGALSRGTWRLEADRIRLPGRTLRLAIAAGARPPPAPVPGTL